MTEWFDYLKQEGLYDNTRIILVSDHGFGLEQIDELLIDKTAKARKRSWNVILSQIAEMKKYTFSPLWIFPAKIKKFRKKTLFCESVTDSEKLSSKKKKSFHIIMTTEFSSSGWRIF